ncbi:hypothetical protein BDV95DRAFT_583707 [Massariosphaeria phaeospora]|uniref:Zn(2)-C6 fungal-type domain-containing protein n=1 Tax=Massariosphaeria phaeospora TaxID=100035 RepID=A0A7C8M316_9PLEO|nr:hypothetical protein BDV95DRAFT_583707 [Massariosphaeria phaeospora]
MKLACVRCKFRKIKCDKGEPICHQCITASAECVYVERRKRPRLAEQKVEVRSLSRRLELLEKHVTPGSLLDRISPSTSQSTELPVPVDSEPAVSPSDTLIAEGGPESWIYRMANETTLNFEKANTCGPSSTASNTPAAQIGNAMSGLHEALEDLAKFRIRVDGNVREGHALKVTPDEGKACVEAFFEMVNALVVPDIFLICINMDVLRAIPDIIESPYVNVDPGIRILYYNALYYGIHKVRGAKTPLAQAAYRKVLETVPSWLESSAGGDLDGHTAALTAWTAINNFDYQLSWKFHCKSCQFLKMKGIDHLDVVPAKTHEEEDSRDGTRYLYWHILQTDLLFRLFYGKPAAIKWSSSNIKPPTLVTSNNLQPPASQVIIFAVWIRYTVMTAEIFQVLDSSDTTTEGYSRDVLDQVDMYCSQLEDLVVEFNIEHFMKQDRSDTAISFLFADHLINIYASIIGIRKLTRRATPEAPIDACTLRAARVIIAVILQFNLHLETDFGFSHFLSFYPFCAVFSLYEYILACETNPDDCEADIQSLERIALAMGTACAIHPDFVLVCNTINALNKVSRSIQAQRRNPASSRSQPNTSVSASTSTAPAQPQDFTLPAGPSFLLPATSAALVTSHASILDFSNPNGFPFIDFPLNLDGDFPALGFVRAVENDVIGRNWHEGWWDMGGDGDLGGLPPEGG